MLQPNHALFIYPVVGLLSLAAAVPILSGSLSGGVAEAAAAPVAPARVVVASSQPAIQREPPVSVSQPSRPTPTAGPASGGESRWWREQLDRLATMSVVRLPQTAPKAAPAPILDRAQRDAAEREATAAAARAVAAVPPAPQPAPSLGDLRLGDHVPAAIRRWEPLIARAARKYDLDPNLIAALMQTESGGNPSAVSPMNAIGLLQVLNGPSDPEANIDEGAAMLAGHLKRFGSLNLALAAYNAGPGAVLRYGGIPPYDETYNHVTRTLASYAAFRGG